MLINAYARAVVSPLAVDSWPADADARRGIATRFLIAEDARWVQDVALSAAKATDGGSSTALLLSHHFVRIAYEGAIALRSGNEMVGMPFLAELLTDQFAAITERARHMSKLLDDTKKSEEEVLAEIEDALLRMRSTFLATVPRLARWRARDLGEYRVEDRVIGATVPMAYRLGLDGIGPNMFDQAIVDVTQEWGSAVAVLCAADL